MDGVATMTKAYRFTFVRKSIFEEIFHVEADTLEEARTQMEEGGYPDATHTAWVDWYDDEFGVDPDFPPQPLCPLYKMIKEHECDTSS